MIIFGIHSCLKAIKSGRCKKIYIQNGKPVPDCDKPVIKVNESDIQKMVPQGSVHQGILAEVDESSYYADITDLISAPPNCGIAILDGVTDPHNLGAIIRTAAAFGISGIILSEKASCKITGTVVKASSGGIEHVSVYIVKNLASTIEKLKEYGFWIFSICESGEKYIDSVDMKGKTCLIFGAEGNGIRRLQKEKSDFVVKLPTTQSFSTLNVSNAAAIAFYELAKQNCFYIK